MKYEFLDEWLGDKRKRDRPQPAADENTLEALKYQSYSVRVTAGDTTWSTEDEDKEKLPRCEVGQWDTHGTWDPDKIVGDFINGLLGGGSELPVSNTRWL